MNNKFISVLLSVLVVIAVTGCNLKRPVVVPLKSYHYNSGATRSPVLIVLLPGVNDSPRKFQDYGFISDARARGLSADFVAVDTHLGYFEDKSIVRRLHADIIVPALQAGYRQIWLVGISLGGFGTLLYASYHPDEIEGIVLLAPYLGSEELIAEIKQQGGLDDWQIEASPFRAKKIWGWLKRYSSAYPDLPAIYLGYGKKDKLKDAQQLLASELDPGHVFTLKGKHNWKTWRRLWQVVLERKILAPGRHSASKNNPR